MLIMATDATVPQTESQTWPALNVHERRVLGVLVEKAKTTPDIYPMTLNAIVTGCNQKSNRDPVLNLGDEEVEEAIASLKKKGLAQQITGSGRVDKFRHVLYDALRVDKVQLAIIGELLVRGPQTEGELRGRASRMEPIADLDQLRPVLRTLADRGLVVYLTPEGRRGTMLTHGFHPPEELARIRARAQTELEPGAHPVPTPARTGIGAASVPSDLEHRLRSLEDELRAVRVELGKLQADLATLCAQGTARQTPPATP
jgi:uncharacterized protein YceH (UPF0502 family)